jgi:hypothetical protein
MNGPIVDAQAQLNPTSEVSAVAQSPPTLNGGRKARVRFSVIRGLTRNGAAPLSSAGRPLVSLANSAWCTAHQRQGEKWSPSFANGTQLCRFQSPDEPSCWGPKGLGFNQIQFPDHTRSSSLTIRGLWTCMSTTVIIREKRSPNAVTDDAVAIRCAITRQHSTAAGNV